jgi:hypothetical protein
MTCLRFEAETLVLHFYAETDPSTAFEIEAHLPQCASCRAHLEELTAIRTALRAIAAPGAATAGVDWARFGIALNRRIDAIGRSTDRSAARGPFIAAAPPFEEPGLRVPPDARGWPGRTLAAAAALTLMVGALGAVGWQLQRAAASVAQASAEVVERNTAIETVASRHFERSKLVVLGLLAKDPANPQSDWSYERRLASTLWVDTRMYRTAATRQGLPGLAKTLGDLEVVLVQTAFSHHADGAALDQLQRLIRARDLRLTMDVLEHGGADYSDLEAPADRTGPGKQ